MQKDIAGLLGWRGDLKVWVGWRIRPALTAIGDCARIVQVAYWRWLIADRQDSAPAKFSPKQRQLYTRAVLPISHPAIADTQPGLSLRNSRQSRTDSPSATTFRPPAPPQHQRYPSAFPREIRGSSFPPEFCNTLSKEGGIAYWACRKFPGPFWGNCGCHGAL